MRLVVLVAEVLGSTIQVTATDEAGAEAKAVFSLTVTPLNDTPFVSRQVPGLVIPEDSPGKRINLQNLFPDADIQTNLDSLSFSAASSNTALTTVSVSDSTLELSFAPNQTGAAVVDVVATATLQVTDINDPPEIDLPLDPYQVLQDTDFNFSGIELRDVDAIGNNVVEVSLSVQRGNLNFDDTLPLDVMEVNGESSVRLRGTLSQVRDATQSVT